ncbi:Imm26 family immunity protein [Curtobacterium aetherium]|uniref:Imm26 family immunity protein n=1 Tax=Curtobacterium aetherium TaxID=2841594 RepID=UPI003B52E2BA
MAQVVKSGDLLTIPLGDGRAFVGQVVDRTTRALYVVVFDHPVGANPTLEELAQAQTAVPLFATLTFDTRICPGMWTVVGNSPVERDRFLPAFTYGAVENGRRLGNGFPRLTTAPGLRGRVEVDSTSEDQVTDGPRASTAGTRRPCALETGVRRITLSTDPDVMSALWGLICSLEHVRARFVDSEEPTSDAECIRSEGR